MLNPIYSTSYFFRFIKSDIQLNARYGLYDSIAYINLLLKLCGRLENLNDMQLALAVFKLGFEPSLYGCNLLVVQPFPNN